MAAPSGQSFFLVPELPGPGRYVLDGPEGHHGATVRRIRSGEHLVLCDGHGGCADAVVDSAGRGELVLVVGESQHLAPPQVSVTLAQALPKGERSDLAVELATEAGVDAIVPWQARRCVARWSGAKCERGRQRWQTVARQAAKQARRAYVPEVGECVGTEQLCELVASFDVALVLHEAATCALANEVFPARGSVLLIVGPEGGVDPDELAALCAAGAAPVLLGQQVLRTSTAAAVALGALGVLAGRWK